jgi:hypothetical protein
MRIADIIAQFWDEHEAELEKKARVRERMAFITVREVDRILEWRIIQRDRRLDPCQ